MKEAEFLQSLESNGIHTKTVDTFPTSEITVTLSISPTLASTFLARQERNRPVLPAKLEQYQRDILAGHWHLPP